MVVEMTVAIHFREAVIGLIQSAAVPQSDTRFLRLDPKPADWPSRPPLGPYSHLLDGSLQDFHKDFRTCPPITTAAVNDPGRRSAI